MANLNIDVIYADAYNGGALNATTLNAAITAIAGSKTMLYVKAGTWTIGSNVDFSTTNIRLYLEQGAILQQSSGATVKMPSDFIFSTSYHFDGGPGFIDLTSGGTPHEAIPHWWGAIGDGANDDTDAIREALAAAYAVFIPTGEYLARPNEIEVGSGRTLRMMPDTVIKAMEGEYPDNQLNVIVRITGSENVRITGGVIDGNKSENPTGYTFGLFVTGDARQVYVEHLTARNCPGIDSTGNNGGDGFTVGETDFCPQDITFFDCKAVDNVRTGLAVITGRDIKILNSTFQGTTGTALGCGIDLESDPETPEEEKPSRITIQACDFSANRGGDLIVSNTSGRDISIIGNHFHDSPSQCPFLVYIANDRVTFQGNTMEMAHGHGVKIGDGRDISIVGNVFSGNQAETEGCAIYVVANSGVLSDINIVANTFSEVRNYGVYLSAIAAFGQAGSIARVNIVSNTFRNCQTNDWEGVVELNATSTNTIRHCRIALNSLYDDRGGSAAKYGIVFAGNVSSDAHTHIVSGNWVQGFAASAYSGMPGDMLSQQTQVVQNGLNLRSAATFDAGSNLVFDTATGTKIGTSSSQKIGFWNSTPVTQPSSAGELIGFTAGSGTGTTDESTFTGNVGTKAYTISDIVKHLKTTGILASS